MTDKDDIEGLKEAVADEREWRAKHDGRIDAWWHAQHRRNDVADTKHEVLDRRVSSVEKKMMWVAGIFAGVGSMLSNYLFP